MYSSREGESFNGEYTPMRNHCVTSRMDDRERWLVEIAACLQGRSRSSFLRCAALREAERELDAVRQDGRRGKEDRDH